MSLLILLVETLNFVYCLHLFCIPFYLIDTKSLDNNMNVIGLQNVLIFYIRNSESHSTFWFLFRKSCRSDIGFLQGYYSFDTLVVGLQF